MANNLCYIAALFLFSLLHLHQTLAQVQPYRNVSEIISDMGYPVENYWALTEDGFYLSIIRIPHGKKEHQFNSDQSTYKGSKSKLLKDIISQNQGVLSPSTLKALEKLDDQNNYNNNNNNNNNDKNNNGKPVVFLQHGLLDSASTWVINLEHESLGFILADAGFDVFLGNARGNTYSATNKYLNATSADFWNLVDFDYMISIDLPTMINASLAISGQKSLIYVGHSQGTLMGFCGFSSQPWLADKVDIFIALAPVAFVDHIQSYLLNFLAEVDLAFWLFWLGQTQFLPSDWIVREIAGTICVQYPWACADIVFLLAGFDTGNLNTSRIPLYIAHTPAGTSVRNMLHWSQMVSTGRLQMFDYGISGNIKHYGTAIPPLYHPEHMYKPPVAFFTGGEDILADAQDALHLVDVLPESNKPVLINLQWDYNHLDFTWGVNANKRIYPDVVDLAKKYSRPSK